jgi:MoxR-like ATPase
MVRKIFQHVSEAPTNPATGRNKATFDVEDLYRGPVAVTDQSGAQTALDEKLRQAYFWIVNQAVISPHYDIEFNEGQPQSYVFGDQKSKLTLPTGQSYSSFILVPLLNLAVRRRCLLIGGPGRGKTSSATLMGILAGYSIKDVRRAIQHGQPQMTISDMLGNPLPADLVSAKSMEGITISWRKWLSMRVKIIDEYNRIPTRTQSALLTVLSDNYAEILDHIYECPPAAWYLTANDDAGGGTYQVIEALKDRIDVVVRCLHFNTRFLHQLLARVEEDIRPEEAVPRQLIFAEEELDRLHDEVLQVEVPLAVRRRIEFFASQFEFCEQAGVQFEYKTKDTIKLAGQEYHLVAARDSGRNKLSDLGVQTQNGLSVRSLLTLLIFVKALAYFRGNRIADLDDVIQIIPFVLHDKLVQDTESQFLQQPGMETFRLDRLSWIRHLFVQTCAEYDRLGLDRDDPVLALMEEFNRGLDAVSEAEARARLVRIERLLNEWSSARKLYGHIYDDIVYLKYLHQRYTNYLSWLKWKN